MAISRFAPWVLRSGWTACRGTSLGTAGNRSAAGRRQVDLTRDEERVSKWGDRKTAVENHRQFFGHVGACRPRHVTLAKFRQV